MAPVQIVHNGGPMLVFEPAETYLLENKAGYWGPVTSSIDWCERNYVVSFFVGEWWSTLSISLGIVLALWGMCVAMRHGCELRFVAIYMMSALVGVGSVAFHGTLTHIGQQGDETPMIFSAACWMVVIWFMDPTFEARHPGLFRRCAWVAVVLCLIFAYTHYVYRFTTSFQIFFGAMPSRRLTSSLPGVVAQWRRCTNAAALRFGRTYYLLTIVVGLTLWLCDQHFCVHLHSLPGGLHNPQFHAWWHGIMGVHSYLGPTFMVYQRLVYLGREPRLCYLLGVLPYVEVPGPRGRHRREAPEDALASGLPPQLPLQVLNLTLMGEAAEHDTSGSNGTSNGAAFSLGGVGPASAGPNGDFDDLDTVHIEGGEEAISDGGPTLIARARRPSYSRLAAPSAVRTPSRPRSRRSTHDLAYGRARVEATSVSSSSVPSQRSSSVPSQRSNALPTQKSDEDPS